MLHFEKQYLSDWNIYIMLSEGKPATIFPEFE